MQIQNDVVAKFQQLFKGRADAFGTGQGHWIKRPLVFEDWQEHLEGKGTGIGIAPLLPDSTVNFAVIDLDEPDFEAARELQEFIPGASWIERSRSGNAHIWVFFKEPIEAWIPRGILREAVAAIGKRGTEVFPKQDTLKEGMLGNYINLPYHGKDRPILPIGTAEVYGFGGAGGDRLTIGDFLSAANARTNDPEDWKKRAHWLGIPAPDQREKIRSDFGTSAFLHICAEHIIANREANPIAEGHRHVVFFNLAKMLLNYEGFDQEEALHYMELVNDSSPDPLDTSTMKTMLENAERGGFTSTGCDDSLMAPYISPDCPIANGG